MFCCKCGVELKKHEPECPHCHEVFVPDDEPILSIDSGIYIINLYKDRINLIDIRELGGFYGHGGGVVGALFFGAIHYAKGKKLEKANGLYWSIPFENFTLIKKVRNGFAFYWNNPIAKKGKTKELSTGVPFNKGHKHLNSEFEKFKEALTQIGHLDLLKY